ncbi:cytochrome P450 [Pleurotus eryngii]|uniref:Cytochrome P450 n=1 Tax=Pleurotus eryngii TaxID=5323 RepID=A0A9P6A7U8_PLEER|nr:cytochrome P450 [Pleurotus eryngii]
MESWIALVVLVFLLVAARVYVTSPNKKLPPGPPGLPLIGNIHQLDNKSLWVTFRQWTHQYGSILYLNVAGQPTVILGDHKTAADLLDRRAAIYSDRPRWIVLEILTGGLVFAFCRQNDIWKRMRRSSHEALNPQIARQYFMFQEREATLLIDQLRKQPALFEEHLDRAGASLALSTIYGLPTVTDSHDARIVRVDEFTQRFLKAAMPGTYLVEYFTWLAHLPRWMSPWRKYAEDWFKRDSVWFESLFTDVIKRLEDGTQPPCVASTLLEEQDKKSFSGVREAAWMCATLYIGSAETTSGQMMWFVLAMSLYPEVQRKAQEEIDRVVGRDRTPTFKDFDALMYIRAIVKETLRWRPVGPIGIPHRLVQDDWYEGYFLPKGTICMANIWGLNLDSTVYGPDVESFNPERFLDSDGNLKHSTGEIKEEGHVTYGFGQRACAGRYVANNSLFIQIATILWAYNVRLSKDSKIPDPAVVTDRGLGVRPEPFLCDFEPRAPEVLDIIAETKDRYELPA